MMWLLRDDVAREIASVSSHRSYDPEALRVSAEMVTAARRRRAGGPTSLRVSGDVAEITVEGILTSRPNPWASLIGVENTTYPDLQAAIEKARTDPKIKSVRVVVDSPGGTVDGLFDTLAAFEALRAAKTVTVHATNAFSAAYAIAAVAGPIEAAGVASGFGSVGVVASYTVSDQRVDLTNTDSPDKRPDVRTAEGRAVVTKYLDSIHKLFVGAIARGRKTTPASVTANYGRGALFVSGDAKELGMIDSIALRPGEKRDANGARVLSTAETLREMDAMRQVQGTWGSRPRDPESFAEDVACVLGFGGVMPRRTAASAFAAMDQGFFEAALRHIADRRDASLSGAVPAEDPAGASAPLGTMSSEAFGMQVLDVLKRRNEGYPEAPILFPSTRPPADESFALQVVEEMARQRGKSTSPTTPSIHDTPVQPTGSDFTAQVLEEMERRRGARS